MKFTIFLRLVIGYSVIIILTAAVNIYAIVKLSQLEEITHSILEVDNRLMDLEQKLSESFLSMQEYESKSIIVKDDETYKELFRNSKDEFDRHLHEIMLTAEDEQIKNRLKNIEKYSKEYQSLFSAEVKPSNDREQNGEESDKKERGKAINGVVDNLKKIKIFIQSNTYKKVQQLNEAEAQTIRVATGITVASFIFVIIISIVITLNITKPLSIMKKKTREIARGEFGGDLKLFSPPEIGELSQAFNSMCSKLKEIDKIKSDFFSLMSHELRTPLTSIKEGANLLIEGLNGKEIDEKQKKLMTIIMEESNRLIGLVNSLLDLSKMEAGMVDYNFSLEDLTILNSRVIRELAPLAESKNITIALDTTEKLPRIKVDSERILLVLRNLIGNALKFTPNNGAIQVHVQKVPEGLEVSIVDTGVGIAKENLSTIFDKFQQDDLANSTKIKGTGLGLSIVKFIVQAHGGRVWAESTQGQGSTFAFVLPS
jgi:two-component system sensor histidine kinase GlrK